MKYKPVLAQTIGEFCKLVRLREKMTQDEFAAYLEVSKPRISQVENDISDIPLEYLRSIENFLTDDEFEFVLELCKQTIADRIRG